MDNLASAETASENERLKLQIEKYKETNLYTCYCYLFNEDVRNAIMSGMKLCQVHVDKCIKEVRVNCHNVYQSSADVWLDFDSRIIQPEYYNFVLRKTGLTPNQAENTCLLLDRNTYGSSFAAVSDANVVNSEYS